MRHLLALLTTLLLANSAAWAQEPTPPPARDAASLLAGLRSDKIVRVTFSEDVALPFLQHPLKSSGTLIIHPKGYFIRNVVKPAPSSAVVTGSRIVARDESGTTTIDGATAPEVAAAALLLRSVFTGNVDALRADYTVAVEGPRESKSWSIILTRRAKNSFFETCVVRGEGERIATVTLQERDDVVRTIAFQSVTQTESLSSDEQQLLKLATGGE